MSITRAAVEAINSHAQRKDPLAKTLVAILASVEECWEQYLESRTLLETTTNVIRDTVKRASDAQTDVLRGSKEGSDAIAEIVDSLEALRDTVADVKP